MKKILAIVFALVLVLGLALPTAVAAAPTITKTLSAENAQLGDTITVTIQVTTDTATATVSDTLPGELSYLIGSFQVDGNPAMPTVAGQTISYTLSSSGTITFDVQVTSAEASNITVTNTATVTDAAGEVESDAADLTIVPYAGFSKQVVRCTEDDPYNVPWHMDVHWLLLVQVVNVEDDAIDEMTDLVVKDNLGGDLEVHTSYNEGDYPGKVFINPPPTSGTLDIVEKGNTKKLKLTWEDIDDIINDGDSESIWIEVSTDVNPGQAKKTDGVNEYTELGPHDLNSGATLKFIDSETGLQLSAHTAPITVVAYEPAG